MTKIFCDIADKNLIKKFNKKLIVKGFTTNPSLMRKAGAKNYQNYSLEILKITKKPVSFEVFADSEKEMITQGIIINKWGNNVFVKVTKFNKPIGTENVMNTNLCEIAVCNNRKKNRIIILSAIDNLLKGGSGQAVQNMNVIFKLKETHGLS